MERETDLNKKSVEEVLQNISGKTVLDVGCGKAFLSDKLQKEGYDVTAMDIDISDDTKKNQHITYVNGFVENIPLKDKSFDTVICTHTLEHVLCLEKSIQELRRVCKKRLIIVVPLQRHYKYTFDLHLHFFPYPHSFLIHMRNKKYKICKEVEGDLLYVE